PLVTFAVLPNGYFPLGSFFFAHDEHKRDFPGFGVAYFPADFLVSVVKNATNILLFQLFVNHSGILVELFGYRQNSNLIRSEPKREIATAMLYKHRDEALQRTERRPVDHHRTVLLII